MKGLTTELIIAETFGKLTYVGRDILHFKEKGTSLEPDYQESFLKNLWKEAKLFSYFEIYRDWNHYVDSRNKTQIVLTVTPIYNMASAQWCWLRNR